VSPEQTRRVEAAIVAARAVAASPEAKDPARRSNGMRGTWTKADEERLRRGEIVITNDHGAPYVYRLRGAP